jgi:hypothetical protein
MTFRHYATLLFAYFLCNASGRAQRELGWDRNSIELDRIHRIFLIV